MNSISDLMAGVPFPLWHPNFGTACPKTLRIPVLLTVLKVDWRLFFLNVLFIHRLLLLLCSQRYLFLSSFSQFVLYKFFIIFILIWISYSLYTALWILEKKCSINPILLLLQTRNFVNTLPLSWPPFWCFENGHCQGDYVMVDK